MEQIGKVGIKIEVEKLGGYCSSFVRNVVELDGMIVVEA